jgi:hypothetical protein
VIVVILSAYAACGLVVAVDFYRQRPAYYRRPGYRAARWTGIIAAGLAWPLIVVRSVIYRIERTR